jgi:hypothetical protein
MLSTRAPRTLYPVLALVACTTAAAVYLLAPGGPTQSAYAEAAARYPGTPTATQFAHSFVGTTNAYAQAHGDSRRIANADCVQASRGQYMCSYAEKSPGAPLRCHIMQARWTPRAASTITVTLAGRADRCGSLRDALRSLA